VAATLTAPPDALVYRGLAHGLDETTDGTYAEDPGESVQKTTWDYWDAKQELNLAVERWADGRVECFHGRRIDPKTVRVEGARGATAAKRRGTGAAGVVQQAVVAWLIVGFVLFIPTAIFTQTLETAFTVALGGAGLGAFLVAVQGLGLRAWAWVIGAVVLAVLFYRWSPLTSIAGVVVLLLVPAAVTLWIASGVKTATARPAATAAVAAATATLFAGLFNYYWFAPVPRSIGQYVLAVGPAPLTGLVALGVAWAARKVAT
jgi:hypothetical protein